MRRLVLYFIFASLIGAFFLVLAARELPFAEIQTYVAGADAGRIATYSLLFLLVYSLCHGARVVRWYYLVRPLDEDISASMVHRVCLVGMAAILILPLRLGEFVRPLILSKKADIRMSAALGTAVVERVVDGLIITGLLFATLATYSGARDTAAIQTLGLISAAVFVPALTVCLAAFWRREWSVSWVRRILKVGPDRIADKLADMLDAFILGFKALAKGRSLGKFLLLSVLYWLANAASMWVLAQGFELDLGLWQVFTVLSVLVVGLMVPAGPGMAGNFQYFLLIGTSLFLAVEQGAIGGQVGAFAGLLHILQFVVISVPGIIVLALDKDAWELAKQSALSESTE